MSCIIEPMKRTHESGVVNWIIIIIGLLIVLTLVGYFTSDRSDRKKDEGTLAPINQPDCGLVVQQPQENSLVTFPVAVSGYLRSCDRTPFSSEHGTVKLLDANGKVIGPEMDLLIVGNWVGQPATFSVFVPAKTAPQTGTGFLVFTNHDKTGAVLNAFQIPVKFPN